MWPGYAVLGTYSVKEARRVAHCSGENFIGVLDELQQVTRVISKHVRKSNVGPFNCWHVPQGPNL
jgi:hypothetical protein